MPYDEAAFSHPDSYTYLLNPEYWNGYQLGKKASPGIPGPAGAYDPNGVSDYAYYQSWVYPCLVPSTEYGYPISGNVGFNNAVVDWSNYLWTHDPQSPYFVPKP